MVKKTSLNSLVPQRKQATVGVQEARILRVVDLGVRKQEYKGEVKSPKTVLSFVFELADDKISFEGKEMPMIMFKSVVHTGGERATLTKLARAAGISLSEEIDFADFIGTPVSLELGKSDKGNTVIRNIVGVSERVGATIPPLVAESFFFDFDEPDADILINKMGKGMHRILREAINFSGSQVEKLLDGEGEGEEREEEFKTEEF